MREFTREQSNYESGDETENETKGESDKESDQKSHGEINGDRDEGSKLEVDQIHSSYLEVLIRDCPLVWEKAFLEFLFPSSKPSNVSKDERAKLLEERFRTFKLEETKLSSRDPQHLVRPSGQLDTSLILKLHYPSFTYRRILDGEVADVTSPCSRLSMNFGLNAENALWIEVYFRREDPKSLSKSTLESCAPRIRDAHNRFARWCERISAAKVEIHFGKRKREEHQSLNSVFKFKVRYGQGVYVLVGLELNNGKAHRLHIYLHHPEHIFRSRSMITCRVIRSWIGPSRNRGRTQ